MPVKTRPRPTTSADACSGSTRRVRPACRKGTECMPEHDPHRRATRRPCWGTEENDVVSPRQTLFRVRPRQLGSPYACRRRHRDPDGRASDAGVRVKRLSPKRSDDLLRGADALRGDACASPDSRKGKLALRLCVSAGEGCRADREELEGKAGVEILDGDGSTEMLHIFLPTGARPALRHHG